MENIKSDEIRSLEKHFRINLINSLVGYKSLNLLGTFGTGGTTNLCIVSSAFHLGANPPLVGLVMRPQREHNDTLRNIKATGQFTLNNILPAFYKKAHQTSASYPSGISEFDVCGFGKYFIDGFAAPFVEQSTIRIGLDLRQIIDMEINGTTLVIGEIVAILTDDDVITPDGTIDHIKAETVTVAGLDSYFLPEPIGRLAYAKPGIEPLEI